MMKTVVCLSPGELQLVERPIPQAAAGAVLLRVRRIGLCGTDMHIFRGPQPFLQYPRVMGHELAAEVVSAPEGSELVYVTCFLVAPPIFGSKLPTSPSSLSLRP